MCLVVIYPRDLRAALDTQPGLQLAGAFNFVCPSHLHQLAARWQGRTILPSERLVVDVIIELGLLSL